MAFVVNSYLEGMEYRGERSGVSTKTGKPWLQLVLEDATSSQIEVSVPHEMHDEVHALGLRKGDMVSLDVRAVARDGYISCVGIPMIEDLEA